jgi:hypothetical protein
MGPNPSSSGPYDFREFRLYPICDMHERRIGDDFVTLWVLRDRQLSSGKFFLQTSRLFRQREPAMRR